MEVKFETQFIFLNSYLFWVKTGKSKVHPKFKNEDFVFSEVAIYLYRDLFFPQNMEKSVKKKKRNKNNFQAALLIVNQF